MDAEIVALFRKFQDNQCNATEATQVLRHIESGQHLAEWDAAITQHASILLDSHQATNMSFEEATALYQRIMAAVNTPVKEKNSTRPLRPSVKTSLSYRRIIYIALPMLIAALATALYFYPNLFINRKSAIANEVIPGGNRATLTLADGTKINLDSAKAGIQVNNEYIHYSDGTKINAPIHPSSSIAYNSLTTPKGGIYQIILSDGTKVWLNAQTTLKYPSHFSGNSRTVELSGEAYFAVNNSPLRGSRKGNQALVPTHQSSAPFIVKTLDQEVHVIGTEFNLSSYSDENETKTTLIKGAIAVNSHHTNLQLEPDEQTILSGNNLIKKKVDVTNVISWRNGIFSFEGKSFAQIMHELGRWYNLEVAYEGPVPTSTFFGSAYRDDKLSFVLGLLKSSNIEYQLEGRKLIIKSNHIK